MSLRQLSSLGVRAGVAAQLRPAAVAVSSRRSRKQRRPAVIVNATREFHPSGRKEMLPIIGGALAVAAIATGLRYLVRAGELWLGLQGRRDHNGWRRLRSRVLNAAAFLRVWYGTTT